MIDNRARYLELLKKTLLFELWPAPPVPIGNDNLRRGLVGRALARALTRALAPFGLILARDVDPKRFPGRRSVEWPVLAHTMVGEERLDHLRHAIETVLAEKIPGDLIETGVWRGGSSIFMRGILKAHDVTDRRVFVCDSFAGLPPPDGRHAADRHDRNHRFNVLAVPLDQVRDNFRRFALLDEQVVFVKGWFKDTLPTVASERFAIIRLDGDMYGSTMDALESLYPKLSRGGFCIIDDYALPRCAQAVTDYRARLGITAPILTIDDYARYWRKD